MHLDLNLMKYVELLRDDYELFQSTSTYLPCRCLNRSRSSPSISDERFDQRLSSPCSSLPSGITTTDSGLNTSTGCTTSRSPTPDCPIEISSMHFDFDSLFERTLTKDVPSQIRSESKRTNRSMNKVSVRRSDRVRRVLKR